MWPPSRRALADDRDPPSKRVKHAHDSNVTQPGLDGALAAAAQGSGSDGSGQRSPLAWPGGASTTGWCAPQLASGAQLPRVWTSEDADADDAARGFVGGGAAGGNAPALVPTRPRPWALPPLGRLTAAQAAAQAELDQSLSALAGAWAWRERRAGVALPALAGHSLPRRHQATRRCPDSRSCMSRPCHAHSAARCGRRARGAGGRRTAHCTDATASAGATAPWWRPSAARAGLHLAGGAGHAGGGVPA
jgi:hypothetical protein